MKTLLGHNITSYMKNKMLKVLSFVPMPGLGRLTHLQQLLGETETYHICFRFKVSQGIVDGYKIN